MNVENHFQLFVAVLAVRVSEHGCAQARERLREIFHQQLISAAKTMRAVIAARGVRRADDISEVYQQICLRLIRYFDRLLDSNPLKLVAIAGNIKAYLAGAAGRQALDWLRGTAQQWARYRTFAVGEDESGPREDQLADGSQVPADAAIEAQETAQALRAIHLRVLERLSAGPGADLTRELSELHRACSGNNSGSYDAFLWIYGYLFGAGMDANKRMDLSAALIARMTGLALDNPKVRASSEWKAARNRLDVQIHRLRRRAREALSQFCASQYFAGCVLSAPLTA